MTKPGRIACAVQPCGRTAPDRDDCTAIICGRHWRTIDRPLRERLKAWQRAYRSADRRLDRRARKLAAQGLPLPAICNDRTCRVLERLADRAARFARAAWADCLADAGIKAAMEVER